MKCNSPKLYFFITLLMAVPFAFYACGPDEDVIEADIDSYKGFEFRFSDSTIIDKIDFVGSGRSNTYNSEVARVTLNPADTNSVFEIHYKGASGTIYIGYTPRVEYDDAGKVNIIYDAIIRSSSFSRTYFLNANNPNDEIKKIEIVR